MKKKRSNTTGPGRKKDTAAPEEKTSRRSFFNRIWVVAGIVAGLEMLAVAIAFLLPNRKKARAGDVDTRFVAGAADQFPRDSVTAFVRGKFYLARLADGGFLALSRKCTHLGCTVPWVAGEKKFVCPCHASAFDIRGEVVSPPASRALDIYTVHIENNVVTVDTGRRIKRTGFRAENVTYPGQG